MRSLFFLSDYIVNLYIRTLRIIFHFWGEKNLWNSKWQDYVKPILMKRCFYENNNLKYLLNFLWKISLKKVEKKFQEKKAKS